MLKNYLCWPKHRCLRPYLSTHAVTPDQIRLYTWMWCWKRFNGSRKCIQTAAIGNLVTNTHKEVIVTYSAYWTIWSLFLFNNFTVQKKHKSLLENVAFVLGNYVPCNFRDFVTRVLRAVRNWKVLNTYCSHKCTSSTLNVWQRIAFIICYCQHWHKSAHQSSNGKS